MRCRRHRSRSLCTHFFRDHAAGAAEATRRGIPLYVPAGEREIFADPGRHFRQRDTYIIYDNYWDLFAPIEAAPVTGVLRDYDTVTLAGVVVEIVPLPGVTVTQIGLAFTVPGSGQRAICCGEAIHSPGRVARVRALPIQLQRSERRAGSVVLGALTCATTSPTFCCPA